jgi:hypothetical protein
VGSLLIIIEKPLAQQASTWQIKQAKCPDVEASTTPYPPTTTYYKKNHHHPYTATDHGSCNDMPQSARYAGIPSILPPILQIIVIFVGLFLRPPQSPHASLRVCQMHTPSERSLTYMLPQRNCALAG